MNNELQCHICQKQFARREHFTRHVQTHTNERPFECSTCHMTFARIDALSRHCSTRHMTDGTHQQHSGTQKVQMACVNCGKAKVRCTGTNPCQRCVAAGLDCHYNPHRRATKAKRRQQQLQQQQQLQLQQQQQLQLQQNQTQNQQAQPSTSEAMPIHNEQCHSATISSSNIVERGEPTSDQQSTEFAREAAGLGTPSSLPNANSLVENHQQQQNIMEQYPDMPDFNLTDFGFAFGDGLGDTMPSLSGIEWAMLDLPRDTSGSMVHVNFGHENVYDVQQEESHQAADPPSDTEIEPRQFKMTTISRDAPLRFPDMEQVDPSDFDDEDRAHVAIFDEEFFNPLVDLATKLQVTPFHPLFERLVFPPTPVMNIFIQLYFEHFHPLLPILHKPTFSPKTTHWLLICTVAAIGSRYSKVPDAKDCSLALLEVMRRLSSYMCESDNKRSRDIWMLQVILLGNAAMMYCGDPRMMEIAELKQSLPVSMSRRKRIFDNTPQNDPLQNTELNVYQKWRIWISIEERRRLAFAVWILDSNHGLFLNLTTLMTMEELRCPLPCSEVVWDSPTAQAWATHNTVTLGITIKTIFETHSLLSNWWRLGYLGKQALIHCIFRTCQDYKRLISLHSPEFNPTLMAQRELQLSLLDAANEAETQNEMGGWSSSSSVSIRLLIHLVRMVIHAPFPELPNWVFRKVSGVSWQNDAKATTQWMIQFPHDCRMAVLHAGQAYALMRDTNCNGFTDAVVLLYSAFVFWAFTENSVADSQISPKPQSLSGTYLPESPESPTMFQTFFLDGNYSPRDIQHFVQHGAQLCKIRSVGTITTDGGRSRLLEVLISLMGVQDSWGIGKVYRRILVRLAAVRDGKGREDRTQNEVHDLVHVAQ